MTLNRSDLYSSLASGSSAVALRNASMTLWNATFHMCCSTFSIAQKRKSLANMIRKLFWKNFLLRNQSNQKQKKMLKIPGPNLMRPNNCEMSSYKPVHLDAAKPLVETLTVKQPRQLHVATGHVHKEVRMTFAAPETGGETTTTTKLPSDVNEMSK